MLFIPYRESALVVSQLEMADILLFSCCSLAANLLCSHDECWEHLFLQTAKGSTLEEMGQKLCIVDISYRNVCITSARRMQLKGFGSGYHEHGTSYVFDDEYKRLKPQEEICVLS